MWNGKSDYGRLNVGFIKILSRGGIKKKHHIAGQNNGYYFFYGAQTFLLPVVINQCNHSFSLPVFFSNKQGIMIHVQEICCNNLSEAIFQFFKITEGLRLSRAWYAWQ
ncbi:MAG: hypothetical protein MJA83_12645 [Gammaproteobacteria bacterium]|nr:hypothetical protein [Gammaproteobacteria bacterium]